ncbi:hypothetical protein TSUD_100290 [Trifolium subterraneum]|uniref:Uncharacterized protein n=1 Tax=Trifolium subterraneum TaxID=3900 RepID=A0A2Z6PJI9_TRISU|nr:hypothetical protein TSUD_100290 [Trifolium subterraneum]
MAGKSNFHANLPILDGKNWDTWVKQMKVIFIVQEADEQVNTTLDPLPANATKQQRTTFREAQKKDNKALFLIHQCVDSKVFEKIADATTSKDAWDILQKSDGGDAKVKKVKLQALKRQFKLLEMKNDEAVAEYFTTVETLTNQMKNCGSTLSEEEMVEKVLGTLTHKFDHIVVTIEQTKDLSEIKMEDLQSTLEAHELEHEQERFQESVEDKPESSKKEGGQKTKKDKSTIQCYNCNKYGHYANDSTSEDDERFMVTITDETAESMVWYFDTGCSNHMTGNKSIFTDFNKCLNTRIKLANGNFIAAEGMGNVAIQEQWKKGFKAVFEGETLKLFDSKQRLILKTTQSQNKTFKTQVKTIEVECLATSTEDKDSDLWHIRYGHLNFKSLSMLNSKNMVLGLPSVIAPVDTCTTCLLGKHPRSSLKNNLPMRSSEVLNAVHSDICGPIDVLSTGGNKYFTTFVDEYSSDDDNRSHMTENDNGSDQGPLLMMPTTEHEFGKQEGWYLDTCCSNHMTSNKEWLVNYDSSKKSTIRFADNVPSNILSIEQLVEKGFTLSLGNNQMKVYNVENKMENDKSIKILRTDGASKHTSKESDSEHQKVHISEDVIMNEVHINEDSESDCNAETDVEAPEAEVSAVEANVETRAGSTKARESDVEADAEASEAEVSAVEASVETRARSTRTKVWNAETKFCVPSSFVLVQFQARSFGS